MHQSVQVSSPEQVSQDQRRQGQDDDDMLPHYEDMEEDEEEGGVALIDIFNPFASCDEISSVLLYVTSGCHICFLYQLNHQINSFIAELCLSLDVVPSPGISLGYPG